MFVLHPAGDGVLCCVCSVRCGVWLMPDIKGKSEGWKATERRIAELVERWTEDDPDAAPKNTGCITRKATEEEMARFKKKKERIIDRVWAQPIKPPRKDTL